MKETILKLPPGTFLERSKSVPVIDVRAPKEFRQGHIPGAISLPLFDDHERAIVGTTYTRTGRDEALIKGLEIVGPKLPAMAGKAKEYAIAGELLVHCWRGGMRSEAMAWLFRFSGIKTSVLEGGYRAYRHYIREELQAGPPIIILGGMTGSGKTEILQHLSSLSEQVIDLECLANHKGSAFGSLGQPDQPTTEQFENDLASQWLALDHQKPVWVEDESRNIGKVIIPEPVFLKMMAAHLVYIDVPFDIRVQRLTEEYGSFATGDLIELIRKIGRRMGGDQANAAIQALQKGNISDAVAIVLHYYDKSYRYGLSKREISNIIEIKSESKDLQIVTLNLLKLIQHSTSNLLII